MSCLVDQLCMEQILEQVIQDDVQGKIEEDVDAVAREYQLHPDDDRDEILFFIAETIYYGYYHDWIQKRSSWTKSYIRRRS